MRKNNSLQKDKIWLLYIKKQDLYFRWSDDGNDRAAARKYHQ